MLAPTDADHANRLSPMVRIAIVALVIWAVAIQLSDVVRVFVPLSTLGFEADDAGRVTQVLSPPASGQLKKNDQLDLEQMTCRHGITSKRCTDLLSILGGNGGIQYVVPWHVPVQVTVVRGTRPYPVFFLTPQRARQLPLFTRLALLADMVLAAIFIAIATAMVWQFPNRMTWGFFAYALWFNPGQFYTAYAVLQTNAMVMLAQEIAQALVQGAGYAGFLWFVLRFPDGEPEERWRFAERLIPMVAVAFFGIQLWTFLNLFGVKTQTATILSFALAFAYNAFILIVLYLRAKHQKPVERERLRWVFWGAAIGLPPFLSAEVLAIYGPSWMEGFNYVLYAFNGLVAIAVYYAVRRYRLIDVRFAFTRRVTLLLTWIIFGAGFALLAEAATKWLQGSGVWLIGIVAAVVVTLTFEKLHDAINLGCDLLFFREFHRAERVLAETGRSLRREEDVGEIDRLIVEVPSQELALVSAALFMTADEPDKALVRRHEFGWHRRCLQRLPRDHVLVEQSLLPQHRLRIRDKAIISALPPDDAMPVVGVPIFENAELVGVALYSGHKSGDDLNDEEVRILSLFAVESGESYGRASRRALDAEVAALRAQVAVLKAKCP